MDTTQLLDALYAVQQAARLAGDAELNAELVQVITNHEQRLENRHAAALGEEPPYENPNTPLWPSEGGPTLEELCNQADGILSNPIYRD